MSFTQEWVRHRDSFSDCKSRFGLRGLFARTSRFELRFWLEVIKLAVHIFRGANA
jgi:hypothetical protein